jgi:GT2 family glycosyltransferase
VHDAGNRVVYDPEVFVYHSIGVSESTSAGVVIERHRSIWRYYRKHLGGNAARDAVTGAGIAVRCGVLLGANAVRSVLAKRQ